ncbi:MAG: MFS transporter [Waddliaceae bacterium]
MITRGSINLLRLIINFFAPLASVGLMIFGSAFYTTFLSVFLDSEGYTRGEIGYVHAAFFLGMLLGAFQMEKLIKRVGHIQALAVFGSLATSSTLLQALSQTFLAWIFLRFLFGLSLAALYIVIESWMLGHSTPKTRGVILSLYMICLYASQSASQQVLSFVDIHSFTPFLVSALFTSLSVIPVGLSTSRITLPPSHEPIGFFRIIKLSPFGVSGCFISGLLLSALYSFFPILAVSKGIPSANLMSVTIAGGVILQWPIGKFSDYFERRKTLLVMVIMTLCLTLMGYLYGEASSTQVLSLSFLIGGFSFTLYPLCITQVCDHLHHSNITTATALLLIAYGFGSVLGPVASSMVVDAFGINSLFLYFAALLAILAGIGAYTTMRRPIIPLEDQTEFQPLTNVSSVAYEMDPRSENGE